MKGVMLVLLLAGCATAPTVPGVETITVDKPVPVACLTPDQVPQAPAKAAPKAGASLDQKAAAVGIELDQWRKYGAVATPLLQSCSTLPSPNKGTNP